MTMRMRRTVRAIGAAGACLAAGSLGPAGGPAELAGLWSSGPAGCAARSGLVFDEGAVRLRALDARAALFPQARYRVLRVGEAWRVSITYRPADKPGLTGTLVLAPDASGALHAQSHSWTAHGLARSWVGGADPTAALFPLVRCGAPAKPLKRRPF